MLSIRRVKTKSGSIAIQVVVYESHTDIAESELSNEEVIARYHSLWRI